MHLADRGGRDRLLVELEEEPLDRLAELLANGALDVGERKGTDVVLEAAQLENDVGRHDVGPRREQLPELHEGRPELVEHLAQVPAACCPRSRLSRAATVDRVAEAMANRDLCDLAQASNRALLRARRHALSLARGAKNACSAPLQD